MIKITFTTLALLLCGAVSGMYSVGDMGSSLPPVSQASKSSKSTKSSQKKKKKDSDSKKSTTKTERGSAFEGVKLVSSSSWSDATAKRNELAEEILKAMERDYYEAEKRHRNKPAKLSKNKLIAAATLLVASILMFIFL